MNRYYPKYIFLTLFALLQVGQLFAQDSRLIKANKLYDQLAFASAIPIYENILKKKRVPEAIAKLADCYRLTHDYENAQVWYASLVNIPDVNPIEYIRYAQILMINEQYILAKDWFVQYKNSVPEDTTNEMYKMADRYAMMCDSVYEVIRNPSEYRIRNVEMMNSEFADFAPMFFHNEKEIVISSSRGGQGVVATKYEWDEQPFLDLFVCEQIHGKGGYSKPKPLRKLSTKIHEGVSFYDAATNTIYFTRNNYIDRKIGTDETGEVNLNLYYAKLDGKKWASIVEFPYNADYYSCGHPTLTPDGKILFFVSDMPGGLGGTDLYMCIREGETGWTEPENLGPAINTAGNEMFPYVHENGTLYFSTTGRGGLGGLDLFSARLTEDGFSKVMHLGFPLNSSRDDFGLILDKSLKGGYFSSNRKGGKGMDDIYSVKLPVPPPEEFLPNPELLADTATPFASLTQPDQPDTIVTPPDTVEPIDPALAELNFDLEGTIRDEAGNPVSPDDLKVIMINNRTGEEAIFRPEDPGFWNHPLEPGTEYTIMVEKPGYLVRRKIVSTVGLTESATLKVDFVLEKIELDRIIPLKNIYYDFDKWAIRPDAAAELKKWAQFLNDNPSITVELSSHTDCRGSDTYNQRLSQKRAESAVAYLNYSGVFRKRIVAAGYGEMRLTNQCDDGVNCPEELHQQNRRTEFRIIGISDEIKQALNYDPNDHSYAINTHKGNGKTGPSAKTWNDPELSFENSTTSKGTSTTPAVTNPPEPTTPSEGVVFRIQVGSFSNYPGNWLRNKLGSYQRELEIVDQGQAFKGIVGSYSTYGEANQTKEDLRRMGFPDCFTIAFNDGAKVTVKEAILLTKAGN